MATGTHATLSRRLLEQRERIAGSLPQHQLGQDASKESNFPSRGRPRLVLVDPMCQPSVPDGVGPLWLCRGWCGEERFDVAGEFGVVLEQESVSRVGIDLHS